MTVLALRTPRAPLGAILRLAYAIRLYAHYSDPLSRRMFRCSIVYLFLLFAAPLGDHYARLG